MTAVPLPVEAPALTLIRPRWTPTAHAVVHALSPREREVLLLLADGLSNREIAGRLFVSQATVKSHVAAVLATLQVRDRVQAVIAAFRSGLVPPGGAQPTCPGCPRGAGPAGRIVAGPTSRSARERAPYRP